MNASTYLKELCVDGASIDFARNMTRSAMLRAAQSIAQEHCEAVGYGDSYMASVERVWLLTKLKITVARYPRRAENLTIETTAYAPDRILYPRTTRFLSTQNEELARVESLWVLVDTNTFRIVRKAPESMNFPFAPTPEGYQVNFPPKRDCPHRETVRVRYSMVDVNQHLNNAVYADLIDDALENRLFAGEMVRELSIAYHREAKPGAEIDLGVDENENEATVTGMVDGALCFEAVAKFAG